MHSLGEPAAVAIALVLVPAIALAEPSPPTSRAWRVEVTSVCGDTFTPALLARSPRMILGPDAVRVLRVRVSEERGHYRGVLDVTEGEAITQREVEGTSCEETLQGLALVAALTVENEPAVALPTRAPGAPAPSRMAEPPKPAPSDSKGAAPTPLDIAVGAFAEASSLLPAPLLSVGGQISAGLWRSELFAPSVRVRLASSLPASQESASGRARFSFLTAALDGCPLRVGTRIAVRPCAGFDLGQLTATGDEDGPITDGARRRRLWAAARLLARLEAVPTVWLTVELDGGLLLPITRDSFVFRPAEDIYRPAPSAFGGIGFRVHFP